MILLTGIRDEDVTHLDMVFARFTENGTWVVPDWIDLLRQAVQAGGRLEVEYKKDPGVDKTTSTTVLQDWIMNILQTAKTTIHKVVGAFIRKQPVKQGLIYPNIDTSFLGDAGPLPEPTTLNQNIAFWSKYVGCTVLIGLSEQPGCCSIYLDRVDPQLDRLSFRHVHLLERRSGLPESVPVGQICTVARSRCYFVAKIDASFRQTGVKS